jgi:hypothetical protein
VEVLTLKFAFVEPKYVKNCVIQNLDRDLSFVKDNYFYFGKQKREGIPLLVYGKEGGKEVERIGGKDGGQRSRVEESRLWRDEIKKRWTSPLRGV